MTVLYVVDCPGDFPRIWIRNDRKHEFLEGRSGPRLSWQCEGEMSWHSWEGVLSRTKGHRMIPIYGRSEW